MQILDGCPLCNFTAARRRLGTWTLMECRSCGQFAVHQDVVSILADALPHDLKRLREGVRSVTDTTLIYAITSAVPRSSPVVDLRGGALARSALASS